MDFEVAVQSVVFADRRFEGVVETVASTPVERLELWDEHLPVDADRDRVDAARTALSEADVDPVGYGVVDLESPADAEAAARTADRLGAEYLTVNFDPDATPVGDRLGTVAERYDLDVAIHNYSTVHHDASDVFSSVGEVRAFLADDDSPRVGACLDTGHFLVMDEDPVTAIRELGDRVLVVHLKDASEAVEEDVPGRGALDLPELVALLEDATELPHPLVVEYELPPERAEAGLLDAYDRLSACRTGE